MDSLLTHIGSELVIRTIDFSDRDRHIEDSRVATHSRRVFSWLFFRVSSPYDSGGWHQIAQWGELPNEILPVAG